MWRQKPLTNESLPQKELVGRNVALKYSNFNVPSVSRFFSTVILCVCKKYDYVRFEGNKI